ncbi:Rne/Rng family ribonuclease [Psychrobacter sp. 72-O-c]|uniref:Rne/Rng family ribonuclease n=1 Tax=Psychrobacter sp. 72-O-c TaxID=2774125 RepID=UPI0019184473|nr:Rne/Rng family ribonuclease [Psychrobacter sp. 72-O-c]
MKRILINATQNEEIRVALCNGNHLYDFDLENRTREQKKSNIYKGHVTRVEPSLEAVFVEYGSQRQGFLPIREISAEYLSGNPRDENIKKLIKEGDELIVQVEKEERGNKGAALSTYVSLAGRYLVLMPNNPRGGGISRQISGKLREDMKRMLGNLDLPKGMSVIIRTAGIGKNQDELQHDLNHLLNIWQAIQEQNQKYPSPRLVHQEAGVVTRAVRDYLRDDIAEIWIDNENAYIEAAGFIDAVMPKQAEKLRKYTDYEPMFSRFNIEKQIETAYQREVRLPSGGSIVIDQTEALVSIDINSAKSTKGSDVAETAYHTNLEAADEIARQLRLRDMGGLIVIDFIDMNDNKHQKEVEKRLIDATKYDRARVQFGDISKFGLMEMSRQRLRPSLEESTGYICPRCHGNGMIRDLRSLSLSIMRQIEQIALKERQGEVQAEVPTDIAAFLLNEKRDSLVYLEQDSGTRITILPHAHLESPNFKLHFNRDGFAPTSYERITDTQQQEHSDLGYNVDWQTAEKERPEQQPTRQPRQVSDTENSRSSSQQSSQQSSRAPQKNSDQNHNSQSANSQNTSQRSTTANNSNDQRSNSSNNSGNHSTNEPASTTRAAQNSNASSSHAKNAPSAPVAAQSTGEVTAAQPQAVAWLSNLFAQAPQAQTSNSVSSRDAAEAIEALVNNGGQSLGSFGQVDNNALNSAQSSSAPQTSQPNDNQQSGQQLDSNTNRQQPRRNTDSSTNASTNSDDDDNSNADDRRRRKPRKSRSSKPHQRKDQRNETVDSDSSTTDSSLDSRAANSNDTNSSEDKQSDSQDKRQHDNRRSSDRNRNNRQDNGRNNNERNDSERNTTERSATERNNSSRNDTAQQDSTSSDEQTRAKRKPHSQRSSRGKLERGETLTADGNANTKQNSQPSARRNQDPNEVVLQVNETTAKAKSPEVVHLSLDDSKPEQATRQSTDQPSAERDVTKEDTSKNSKNDNAAQQSTSKQSTDEQSTDEQSTDEQSADKQTEDTDSKSVSSTQADTTRPNVDEAGATETHTTEVSANQANTSEEQAQSDAPKDDKVNGDQNNDRQTNDRKPSVDEQPTSKPSTDSQKPVAAEAESDTVQTVLETQQTSNENVAAAANDSALNNSADSNSSSNVALELTHDALFAEHYVTANKFGQASNDPRIVRRQQAQSTVAPVVPASEQAVTNVPTIRGTVGEFIHTILPEATARLADDGVIRSFIDAIAIHTQQTQNAGVAGTTDSEENRDDVNANRFDVSTFTFSNYGYQPLAADYLARFETMTQAVSQFAAAQGKTAVEPRAINKRASNDPRGQHSDYNESEQEQEQEQATLSVPNENSPSDNVPSEQVEQHSQDHVQPQDATETVNEVDAHNVEATALASEVQADSISAESEHMLQADQDQEVTVEQTGEQIDVEQDDFSQAAESMVEDSAKEDSQASKSKTTIASYKNMIENVAEQLSPQTGMFNLTTPKVPKARSRKPKTDHKKPTQAEKTEPGNSDSES